MTSVTVLADVILDCGKIRASISGRNIRKNDRVEVESGAVQANIIWTQSRRQYEFGSVPMLRADWMILEAIHEVTEGGAKGFLLLDPKDHTVSASGTSTGVVTSISSPQGEYQLYRRLTEPVSSRTKDRKITRPKAAGFVIKVNGVALTGGQYTLDSTTGIVTIPSAPAAATVTWTGTFYVPVHFLDDNLDWDLRRPGSDAEDRLLAGTSVVLQEVVE